AGDGVVDVPADEHRSDRRVAGSEPLRGRDDVGDARSRRAGEPASRAADAGHDLVEAHEEAEALTALGEALPEAGRRRVGGQGGRAARLAEERRDGRRTGWLESAIERLERRVAARIEPPGARRDMEVV